MKILEGGAGGRVSQKQSDREQLKTVFHSLTRGVGLVAEQGGRKAETESNAACAGLLRAKSWPRTIRPLTDRERWDRERMLEQQKEILLKTKK